MDGIQGHEIPDEQTQTSSSELHLPSSPNPSADKGIVPSVPSNIDGGGTNNVDISHVPPITALKLFCGHLEALASVTGDIPSTPPPRIEQEMMIPIAIGPRRETGPPVHIIGTNMESDVAQQDVLVRKFFSKTAPGVSIGEYMLRLHRFCPMSTAVYLASSHYINNLAIVERIIPVTPRSVHRLALAALRVAMKALEDLSYPHHRFAKVGGVTENELRKLEIGFCFLTDFNLLVNAEVLLQEATALREGKWLAFASNI